MGSTYIVCCVLAIALNQHVVVEGAECSLTKRRPCLWDTATMSTTAADCSAVAGGCCTWCVTPSPMPYKKKCQTDNFACLVASPKIITGTFTTSDTCVAAGGIFCEGTSARKCICDEPLRNFCYKPGGRGISSCPTTYATQSLCDASGSCFWCVNGIKSRINKCYEIPDGLSCQPGTCCNKLHCASTFTAPTCLASNELCIWDGVTTASMTEQNCHEFNDYCAWCPSQTQINLKCQTIDASCLVAEQWEITAGTTADLCATVGGIYCHGDCATKCICSEPVDKICFQPQDTTSCADAVTTTRALCIAAGCVWCDGTGVIVRQNKCWAMPCGAECAATTVPIHCCKERRCMDGHTFTTAQCTALGCVECIPTTPAGSKLCVYPIV